MALDAAVLTACALLLGFVLWEGRSRQCAEAKSFARGMFDRGSTLLLAVVHPLSFVLLLTSLVLTARGIGQVVVAPGVAWGGIMVLLLGLALRVWANRVLGRFYTRTLRVTAGQQVVREGPYRLVRHPGYLGAILLWIVRTDPFPCPDDADWQVLPGPPAAAAIWTQVPSPA